MSIFRLIRLPNLAIVAFTQYLLYFLLLLPLLKQTTYPPQLNLFHLSLLVIDTLLITGGGYIINDIIDQRIDLINRRDRMIIGQSIAEPTAYWLYFMFTLVGFGLAFYLAIHVQKLELLWLYPLAVIGLYFYSHSFKKQLLIGNLLVSAYCAGVAAILWVAEKEAIENAFLVVPTQAAQTMELFGWYLLFAFLSTFFREMVKDIEDYEGDLDQHCDTVPIRWGVAAAVRLAAIPAILLLVALVVLSWRFHAGLTVTALGFLVFAIGLPILVALGGLLRAKSHDDFHRISQLGKVIMLSGIVLLLLITGVLN